MKKFTLSNSIELPSVGLGVWKMAEGEEMNLAVQIAAKNGYKHYDTATIYKNEKGLADAFKVNNLKREELFITTKVWNCDQGFDNTLKAFDESCKKLNTNYIDLYLVHWPVADKYKSTWKALEKLYGDGKVKAIGVCNFMQHHLEDLLSDCSVKPMVNQVEFHPRLIQESLLKFNLDNDIQPIAWSPLMQGDVVNHSILYKIGEKYNKSAAQITLRWCLQKGVAVIPKSKNPKRIAENIDLFDFELTDNEMKNIDQLDENYRYGPDPDNFNF